MVRSTLIALFAIYFVMFMSLFHLSHTTSQLSAVAAATATPELVDEQIDRANALLQKGLTLYEMEQEIIRLSEQEVWLNDEIAKVEQLIPIQEQHVQHMKERAAKVLRSYHLRERDSLFLMVLSVSNMTETLAMLQFIQSLLHNDQTKLLDYQTALEDLEQLQERLVTTQDNLQQVKQKYIEQREALLVAQDEFTDELAQIDDADDIIEQLEQLTTAWQEKGLPAFRLFLEALAAAMENLPNIQTMYNNVISLRGTSILFQITDEQLTAFLREENELFNHLTFEFNEDGIVAFGEYDDMHLSLTGHYTIVLEPRNAMLFFIDKLEYNDFTLPQSTIEALEEDFKLGFYPDQISFFGLKLKATELQMEPGILRMTLRFN